MVSRIRYIACPQALVIHRTHPCGAGCRVLLLVAGCLRPTLQLAWHICRRVPGRAPHDEVPQARQLRPVEGPQVPDRKDVQLQGAHGGRVATCEESPETALAHPPGREIRRLQSRDRQSESSGSRARACWHGLWSLTRRHASIHIGAAASTAKGSRFAACHTPPVDVGVSTLTSTDAGVMNFHTSGIPTGMLRGCSKCHVQRGMRGEIYVPGQLAPLRPAGSQGSAHPMQIACKTAFDRSDMSASRASGTHIV